MAEIASVPSSKPDEFRSSNWKGDQSALFATGVGTKIALDKHMQAYKRLQEQQSCIREQEYNRKKACTERADDLGRLMHNGAAESACSKLLRYEEQMMKIRDHLKELAE
ncbi:hypothetical protein ACH5RR_001116 [Cinchona calisaya]|uniref:Uncharacterized protein n=1 Tax=Cinchona calisaya TaxID=153742 RepID=A0ABD3B2I4_9GENT